MIFKHKHSFKQLLRNIKDIHYILQDLAYIRDFHSISQVSEHSGVLLIIVI